MIILIVFHLKDTDGFLAQNTVAEISNLCFFPSSFG